MLEVVVEVVAPLRDRGAGTAYLRKSPYTSCDQSLTNVLMSVQNAVSASQFWRFVW